MRRRDLFRKRDRRYFDFSGVTKVEPSRTNNYKYNSESGNRSKQPSLEQPLANSSGTVVYVTALGLNTAEHLQGSNVD